MSKLTKVFALLTLVLWALAAMHCKWEGVPGLHFLKSCCFVDSAASAPDHCEDDGCGPVEDGSYRTEEQTASIPQPLLVLALLSTEFEPLQPELESSSLIASGSESPPGLCRFWQFAYRTALPPRAPSVAS